MTPEWQHKDGRPPNSWPAWLPAAAGVVGPLVFIGAWAALGATKSGYSPVDDAISRLAETGASTRPAMTVGFVVYGAGLCVYAADRRLPNAARVLVAATGVTTFGVAAFPLGHPTSGSVHAAFAGLGYATLAAAPLVTARGLAERGQRKPALWSVVAGTVSGACLVASLSGPVHGLLQRVGLTVGDAWIVAGALGAWAGGRPRRGWEG